MKRIIFTFLAGTMITSIALGDSINLNRPVAALDGFADLNSVFSGIGSSIDPATDQSGRPIFSHQVAGNASATYIATVSWAAGPIEFGLYDFTDPSNKLQLFTWDSAGNPVEGYSITIQFNASGITATEDDGTVHTSSYFKNFGFYTTALDNTYYSEDSLNYQNQARMLTYEGKGDEVTLPDGNGGTITGNDADHWYVACETWYSYDTGDRDFSDLVAIFESIIPVPVPGALLLGILGLSAAGLKLRKHA